MAETPQLSDALVAHPHLDAIVQLALTAAISAADEQRTHFGDGVEELVAETGLESAACVVGEWDLIEILRRPAITDGAERQLLSQLVGRGVAERIAAADVDMQRLAVQVTWLSAHTAIDALGATQAQAKPARDEAWLQALASHVAALDESGTGRAEALLLLMALRRNESRAGRAALQDAVNALTDPSLREAMAEAETAPAPSRLAVTDEVVIEGAATAAPSGTVSFVLQALSGWLLLRRVGGSLLRWMLRVRRPVTVRVSPDQIRVESSLQMMGRAFRTRQKQIPMGSLAAATEEQRASGLGLSVGLAGLALGSYVGFGLITEAALVGSPSLVSLGAIVVFAGVVVDAVVQRLLPVRMGKHCLVLTPRRGAPVALHAKDVEAVRNALRLIREA